MLVLLRDFYPGEETGGGPLSVAASVNLRNILDISETKQEISIETTFR